MGRQHKYEVLVSAKTRAEAIAIASEAIPAHKPIVSADARDVSAEEGADSWLATVVFEGGGDAEGSG
jgi:hypothetical protein